MTDETISTHTGRENMAFVERLVSSILGVVLVLYGLRRLPIAAVALLMGGGYMLYRAASGHCLVYQALGIDRSHPGTMPHVPIQERPSEQWSSRDTVQEASEESFPASDPPSWTAG